MKRTIEKLVERVKGWFFAGRVVGVDRRSGYMKKFGERVDELKKLERS